MEARLKAEAQERQRNEQAKQQAQQQAELSRETAAQERQHIAEAESAALARRQAALRG